MPTSRQTRRDFAGICLQSAIGATAAAGAAPQGQSSVPQPAGTIVRCDPSKATPATAFTRNFEKGRWQLIDYETEDAIKGIMAAAYPESPCAELTLPFQAQGLYRIYVGINYTKAHYPDFSPYGQIEVKLTGERGFRRVGAGSEVDDASGRPKMGVKNEIYKSIQEAYWKTADLTGKSLVIRQPQAPYNSGQRANMQQLGSPKDLDRVARESESYYRRCL